MAVSSNQFLYVSDFQNSDIDAWSNAMVGTLSPIPGSPFSLGPLSIGAGLATTNTGFLYVADVGKVDAFQVGAGGTLTAVPNSPFFSGTNLYLAVDPQDRFLFASDDDPPGGVFAFTIDSTTGGLAAVSGSPFAAIPNSAASSQPSEVVVDSTGNFVYTGLLATGQVAGFAITAPGGTLTPIPGSPFSSGNQPIALATVGKFLYVSNATDGTLSGFTIDSTNGVLTPIAGSPFAIPAGAMTINPGGNVLYASGAAGIYAFTINSTTGALTAIPGSPFPSAGATVLTFVQ
jgi:6-phosphogluconolactonase (cycloisomerase 2 family)